MRTTKQHNKSKLHNAKDFDPEIYKMQAEICAALAHPVRLHILDLVSKDEWTSSELLEVLDLPKANLSQHLSVLRDAGLIQARREGLYQHLSLAIPQIKEACSLVRAVLSEKLIKNERMASRLSRELGRRR